jgi:hypothetical protein
MAEHAFAVLFPQMREKLGIAMRAEAMAFLLELRALFGIASETPSCWK